MKIRIDNVTQYKKIISAICSIPAVRKQLNGIEQCIELKANAEEGCVEISTVDMTSHAIKLKVPAEIVEEGRQIVLSGKLKGMSSKLNPKLGLVISNENNLLNYEMRPYGSIVDNQYFSQDSVLSDDLFDENKYKEVTPDLGYFMELIPVACSNTYNDREVYMTSDAMNLKLYVQFSETSYVRYQTVTQTYATSVNVKAAIRPALLRIVSHLGEEVELRYSPELKALLFSSDLGKMAFKVDTTENKVAKKVDYIIGDAATGAIEVAHDDLSQSIQWQSYNSTETSIVDLDFDSKEEQFTIKVAGNNNLNNSAHLDVNHEGLFNKTTLSVGHITRALKAMGSPKSKILPVETVKLSIKEIKVKNAPPIKAVHLSPDKEDDVTSDVVMYEASR